MSIKNEEGEIAFEFERSLIKLGESSIAITLPHLYVEQYQLKKGEEIHGILQGKKVVFSIEKDVIPTIPPEALEPISPQELWRLRCKIRNYRTQIKTLKGKLETCKNTCELLKKKINSLEG